MGSLSHSEEAAYAARGVSLRVASRSHADNVSFVLCEFSGAALTTPTAVGPEYRLPIGRGAERTAMVLLVLAAIVATLWRVNESQQSEVR